MLTKSVIATLLSVGISASGAQAGLFGYAFNKLGYSSSSSAPNPCNSESFNKKYGQYCSGLFTKSIRCLSDGSNPGVCDSAAVCDTLDRTAKNLCETHCLNTSPQKTGNLDIKVSCTPKPTVQENMQGTNTINSSQNDQKLSQSDDLGNLNINEGQSSVDPLIQAGAAETGIEVNSGSIRETGNLSDSKSIREPNEGAQDTQTADANIYQTEHPKSFDQINTEQPWTMTPDQSISIEGNIGRGAGPHQRKQPSVTFEGALTRQPENSSLETPDTQGLSSGGGEAVSTYPLDEIDQPFQPSSFRPLESNDKSSSSDLMRNVPFNEVQESPINDFGSFPTDFNGYTSAAYQNLRDYHYYSMPD